MSPRISVVIPVLNRAAAVRRAITSVLAQTMQDFEIVVVDDGSKDASAATVIAFQDQRIRLLHHERNRGASAARNTGILASRAPYVAFLDSDDEWLPQKLARQLEVFERSHDDKLALVYTGSEWVYTDGRFRKNVARRYDDVTRRLLVRNVVGETSVGMVRRAALDAIGGFDETLPAAQDADLWLRLSERYHIDAVPDALVRIAKVHDSDRISVNAASSTRGRELFLAKHAAKMRREKVLHLFLRDLGWMYLRSARNPTLARHRYLSSLGAQPLAPRTWAMLIAACMPMAWLDSLADWKHRTTSLLQAVHPAFR
jgi:O-antigen biosynthesis protein